MQINDQNQIALVYYQPSQVMARGFSQYVFIPQANISLAWVKPEHANKILEIKGGCCDGKRKLFRYASEQEVRIWTNKGGR